MLKTWALEKLDRVRRPYSLMIYTDGSSSHEAEYVGAAWVSPSEGGIGEHIKLACGTSILQAEMTAIIYALKDLNTSADNGSRSLPKHLVINTDSLSSLHLIRKQDQYMLPFALSEFNIQHKMLIEKDVDILYNWIPSHVGILGNDLADKYAKTASLLKEPPVNSLDVTTSCIFSIRKRLAIDMMKDW